MSPVSSDVTRLEGPRMASVTFSYLLFTQSSSTKETIIVSHLKIKGMLKSLSNYTQALRQCYKHTSWSNLTLISLSALKMFLLQTFLRVPYICVWDRKKVDNWVHALSSTNQILKALGRVLKSTLRKNLN
jgi:hypothetical protein